MNNAFEVVFDREDVDDDGSVDVVQRRRVRLVPGQWTLMPQDGDNVATRQFRVTYADGTNEALAAAPPEYNIEVPPGVPQGPDMEEFWRQLAPRVWLMPMTAAMYDRYRVFLRAAVDATVEYDHSVLRNLAG